MQQGQESSSWGTKRRTTSSRADDNLPPLLPKRPRVESCGSADATVNLPPPPPSPPPPQEPVNPPRPPQPQEPAAATPTVTGNTATTEIEKAKREYPLRSLVWQHYDCYTDDKGKKKAQCHLCGESLADNPSANGTSTLDAHTKRCKLKLSSSGCQMNLELQPNSVEGQ